MTPRRVYLLAAVIALTVGVLAVLGTLTVWHLHQDHLLIDAIRTQNIQQRQQATSKPQTP